MPSLIRLFVLLIFILLQTSFRVNAQASRPDTLMNIPMFYGHGGFDLAGGDLADRFGNNFEAGGGFMFKTKTNWIFGLDLNYFFSEKVKEGVLDSIITKDGYLIGSDGLFADVRVTERGVKLPIFKVGKIFSKPVLNAGINSGLLVMGGIGFMQHKINFHDVSMTAKQLESDYAKGYDRLSNGLALTQNLGYMYLARNRNINFFIMTEFTQGFTKNRRDYNFSTMTKDESNRVDLMYGLKIGWIFPVYKKLPKTFYYN